MLFELQPDTPDQIQPTAGGSIPAHATQGLPGSYKLNDLLASITNNSCIHWLSEGDWSMHDLLQSILQLAGPSNVYLSSYAFSEYPARLIADLKDRNIIQDLYCVIDDRLDVRSASALNIIRNVATKCKLLKTHAKVTVIESIDYNITVVGSANYTTNKRFESGIVTTEISIAAFHKSWILNAIEKNDTAHRKKSKHD